MAGIRSKQLILWFDETSIADVGLVGGKNASLGEMYRRLQPRGVSVPNGFSVTAAAYRLFLKETGLDRQIRTILSGLNTKDIRNLRSRGAAVRTAILAASLPTVLETAIAGAYRQLERQFGPNVDVAVRSSATAEDLPDASFAGQQETYLNIRGRRAVTEAVKQCIASLFTDRAISYRVDKHFDHFKIALSVGVQKMVRSDLGASGVMFTVDTESGFNKVVLINGAWGLGEYVVKGAVTPDEFYVFKPHLFVKGVSPIIAKKLGRKDRKLVYGSGNGAPTRGVSVPPSDRDRFCLTDAQTVQLARWAVAVEAHYQRPMDLEWALDGRTGRLFIVQARPETIHATRKAAVIETYQLNRKGTVITTGSPVGTKIGAGRARVILDVKRITDFKPGEVLVTDMTDPDWEPIMKGAAAIVTDRGGRTCHAAIVSRELGIPCIVGTGNVTRKVRTGEPVTVSAADGEVGTVYRGILPFNVRRTNISKLPKTRTKVMVNLGNPAEAFSVAALPTDGVGLARLEFIINSHIKVHPLALFHFARLKDAGVRRQIEALTVGYRDKKQFFVDQLAQGVAMIAAAAWPHDVIVRLTDFKTNEYAGLVGGTQFEPKEENPMLGWRGASRYYSPSYRPAFTLECRALKKVRETLGFTNVKVMVPFCRTPEEGRKVLAEMAANGLKRGVHGLDVYIMTEIPSNAILVDEFARHFDGFSIGSNDLTQLVLGVDRDSALVSHIYDERNEAVKTLIRQAIHGAHRRRRKIGICGQAPSDFPDFAQFLVREGIDSISLNPDTFVSTKLAIARAEHRRRA